MAANRLYRTGFYYDTAEVIGHPAIPAYSYTVTEFVSQKTIAGTGSFIYVGDSTSKSAVSYSGDFFWVPSGSVSSYETYSITKTIYVPYQPAVQSAPSVRIFDPPRGWTSFAHSIDGIARGKATFNIPHGVSGVVVGLAPPVASPAPGYSHIPEALLFTGGQVFKLPGNTLLGSYTEATVFTIEVADGAFKYLIDGTEAATATSPYAQSEPLYLSSAMYGPQDGVVNPVITASASSSATFPPMSALSGDVASGQSVAVLPRLNATSWAGYKSVATFQAMSASSSSGAFANSIAQLPSLEVSSYGGTPPIVMASESFAMFGAMRATSILLVGSVGSGTANFPAIEALSGDKPYGTSSATFSRMVASSYDGPANLAFMPVLISLDMGLTTEQVYTERTDLGIGVGVAMDANVVANESAGFSMGLSVDFTLSSTETAEINPVFWFDAPLECPGAFMDAWAVNLDNGASTEYRSYPFETVANIGGRYFGAAFEGLYELAGDTDAGAPIEARFDIGRKDFGNKQLKRIEQIYLGITSKGQMMVKVTAEGASYTYPMREFGEHIQTQRVTPGKGMRANYFGFEIGNTAGCEFEITSLDMMVAESARRI